ncbi:unnamed protein product [Rotaria socialis]|uniref:Uncharacterized protein n=1 Tax=Rotaria socialis TaxID=392032 RepID=A0A819XQK8_9BILA|nr:unnamed protein product [Rotaria socialis]CAF3314028.1 unnamed protein product [Rotaria socialis]CAF4120152.1 unnamed protein product [Rotaria socialis]CAF4144410.1 unnamed protein product [Rotaria socialis]
MEYESSEGRFSGTDASRFCSEQLLTHQCHEPVTVYRGQIEADPAVVHLANGENRQSFAQIDEFSYYGQEAEVLLMLGSIFRLNEIYDDHSSADAPVPIIRMTLYSDHDNDLKQLYDHMKKEYGGAQTNLFTLGNM